MEFRDLKLFLDVAATGSFSRTATLAMTTQSTVSKSITQLESELGVRLFERTGRGATLTAAGLELLPRAETLLADSLRIKGWMSEHRGRVSGTVRIAIQPGLSWPLIEAVLAETSARFPDIQLQVSEGTTHQVEEWLGDGRSDIGVLSRAPAAAIADSHALFSLPLLLVSRTGAAPTRAATVPFSDLADIDLVLSTARNGGRVLVEEEASRRGIALRVGLEINALGLIKRVVASGELCTVAAWPAVYLEVARGELAASRLVEPELRHTYYLATAARRHPTPAVDRVRDMIRRFRPAADWGAQCAD
ncbi:MAG: LysR family transcriptional regulator [Rhodoferax sp.]|jgi:LysR family transcriptional regulator, nitrogen assimilation regulatory protein|nr:LysR family transcriptional regulator [Rhodoferax sp.]